MLVGVSSWSLSPRCERRIGEEIEGMSGAPWGGDRGGEDASSFSGGEARDERRLRLSHDRLTELRTRSGRSVASESGSGT